MKGRSYTVFFFALATILISSKACEIEGVDNWLIAVSRSINDTFRGDILDLSTTNIDAINSITYAEGLNAGPYLDISYTNSRFVISTNTAFERYEEVETSQVIAVTVNFRCTDGIPAFRPFVFRINIVDTNNNAPQFVPSNQFVLTVAPPLPPGFLVTGCFNDITVRDIDLTTQRIDFWIEENPYFEIAYDEASQTSVKEFKAVLRTTTFIRSIPESLTYRITATDVDLTGDPPLTATATVTINGDTDFEFPEELVFTQAFYLANYTEDDRVILAESIALVQGYHESVHFTLQGEYTNNFELVKDGNQLSLRVVTSLPAEALSEQQTLLVIRADREYTSGSTATIIVQFPERIDLEFERSHYEGQIEDNNFRPPLLVLTKGYENRTVSAAIFGDYATHFTAIVQDNSITITTTGLPENVINENNFIHLEIVASNDYSTALAVISLEIIKDDNVTPVFNKPIFEGTYSPEFGLILEQIEIVQGFDDSISIYVEGEYGSLFQIIRNEATINLTASSIPSEIFDEQQIILSLEATKPRTVGANAAVIISLPAARQLGFAKSTYQGTLQGNTLNLEPIVLEIGYEDNVEFFLFGDHASYFSMTKNQNTVSITLTATIPDDIISENNNIILTLRASGPNAVTATTSVLLDIIKDDNTTPVFARNIYVGSYTGALVIERINLIQGFDGSVTFRLDGDHSEYFQISSSADGVALSLRSAIPESVIFEEKVLLFNILAEKPLTVGANAAILIRFPSELTEPTVLRFSQNTYTGTLENNNLDTDVIVLDGAYEDTEFALTGEYSSHFDLVNRENVITILPSSSLPDEFIAVNSFLVLEIEARRERAISGWTSVVIEIVNQDTIAPKFGEAYYSGIYGSTGLRFEDKISLLVGYDETVEFLLIGDFSNHFMLVQDDNSLNLTTITPLPESVLKNNRHLTFTVEARKLNTLPDRAAIFIDIDTEITDVIILSFEQLSYVGSLENNELQLPTISLANDIQSVDLRLTGDYASYFTTTRENNDIILHLNTELPPQILEENTLIILELEASYPNVVSGFTTIIIEVPKQPIDVPVFEKPYYIGEYSKDTGLLFESTISLSQGFNQYVSFALDGEDAQWFTIVENGENNITLQANTTGIEIGKSHLVFSIIASKPGSVDASAAIVISLSDVVTDNPIRFSLDYYVGSIEGSHLALDTINLEGYSDDVTVSITGDYANYFQLTNQNGVFTLQLLSELPDDVIKDNNVLIIILEAQRQNTRAHAVVILEIFKQTEEIGSVILKFEQAYYIGSYSTATNFIFDNPIILSEGYDNSVQFVLEGANSQWFSLTENQNSMTLTLSSVIPDAVLEANRQLVFTVTAIREGSTNTSAVIIIELTKNFTNELSVIGFDRINYVGYLENNIATLQPITLIGENLETVTLTLIGELSSYFTLTKNGPDVSISLANAIPESSLPTNNIILLEIQATSPETNSAYATIVFEVVIEENSSTPPVELRFNEIFYVGSYNRDDGLLFNSPIILVEGFDAEVQFSLGGANSQWFSLVQNQETVSLTWSSHIPDAVIEANHQLTFTVTAAREGSVSAHAVIIIELTNNVTDELSVLGFDRINYVGSLENNIATLQPITLIGDNLETVTITLIGELSSYFTLTKIGPEISISLATAIPESSLPTNNIILLEIQASSPETNSAYATIFFEVVIEEDISPSPVELRFNEIYYVGSFNRDDGLLFNSPIILAEGFDAEVQFSLEGANSQWFSLILNQETVLLTLSSHIPDAVIEANHQLTFTVTAAREGSVSAHAVIIIELTNNVTNELSILGFDRINYVGSLESNIATLQPITLIGDNLETVTITLIGELSSYFTLTKIGPEISLSLATAIPEPSLPTNNIILLEIQATSPETNSAYATIVFEVVIEEDISTPPVELRFNEIYYVGTYNRDDGLLFNSPIILAEGFDAEVQFSLEGANSQWFSLVQNQETVSLTLSSHIPDAVIEANHQLTFTVAAAREGSVSAHAVIIIELTNNTTDELSVLGFDRINYVGSLENNIATLQPIILIGDNLETVTITLIGELSRYFTLTKTGPEISISLATAIPESSLPTNNIILLEIQASSPETNSAYATIVFEVVIEEDISTPPVELRFNEIYYVGSFNRDDGLLFNSPIILAEGFDAEVQFSLEGANSQWFSLILNQEKVLLTLSSHIPDAVIEANHQLTFTVTAAREGSVSAHAVIIIELTNNATDKLSVLGFDRINYVGSLENNIATLQPIILIGDNLETITITLIGELSRYFTLTKTGPEISISLATAIPESSLPTNNIILLEIQASSPETNSAYATIVFEVVIEEDISTPPVELRFNEIYYVGSFNRDDGLLFNSPIILAEGFDAEVQFSLEGANSQWFSLVQNQETVSLTLSSHIPDAVIEANHQLTFTVTAAREGSVSAHAVIIIELTNNATDELSVLGFDRINYVGYLENNIATLQPITLIGDNLETVTITLIGELSRYFALTRNGPDVVAISLETAIPESLLPTNRIILLEIQATSPETNSAYATIVFEMVVEENIPTPQIDLQFDEIYYIGSYNHDDGLLFNSPIILAEGYHAEVQFSLEGEQSQWFNLVQDGNFLSLSLSADIPSTVLENNRKLVFAIKAERSDSNTAWATIIVSLAQDDASGPDVSFEKVLYEGVVQFDDVQHESIRILGYSGTEVEIYGEYSSLFSANVVNGLVTVQASGSLNLLSDVTNIALELHVSDARSVLLLNVLNSDIPIQPSVSFSSPTYIVNVDITQTGLVGHVYATADNGEAIIYSLLLDNVHLQSRVSINSEGGLHLSAPVNSGVYNFKAIATTVISQATANATIHLTVEAITACGTDEFVMPPLIILDRDEEEPHRNLVTLNSTQYPGCQFMLTNRWPIDQTWLYVDEEGLHTTSIDREHESIAFMALSQVKIELILSCVEDNSIRTKRSDRANWLDAYDYGNNNWVLAETIPFNSRRSVVNVIVNDINDNTPIFVGKGDEPIAVGYPREELEDAILPRSLAELQATDADIGENAAIMYWSSESTLAVAPTTGYVHVRSGAQLVDNQQLVVYATDRNGQGLTGSIQLVVKLLDNSHIAVVTVKDAFLDEETSILGGLREAVGYDVRTLRSVVVSDDINEEDISRKKRETDTAGASLRLYVYGLIDKEPVGVERLKEDIITNAITTINVISTISLEDHLEGCEICVIPGRDTGLLVATIVLSVLLFIIITLITVWFCLRWRRNKTYDQFSDENSLASRNDSVAQLPKPDNLTKPRLNIQDLKKSERRLQDMLNTPMEEISVEPSTSRKVPEVPMESILDLPLPETQGPIVIQSIDKLKDAGDDSDDEFGEVNGTRRKSVVTFNENVEKIIHVEDDPEETDSESPGYEIFKL